MPKDLSNIIIWSKNKPGVFFRILSLFRRKLFNIESATVGHTEIPGITRFTITVTGDKDQVRNMCKQVYKLVDVVKVEDIPDEKLVARELAMIKLNVRSRRDKMEILETAKYFRARAVSINLDRIVLEITGGEEKIDAFYENMKQFKILEFVRTGRTALFK